MSENSPVRHRIDGLETNQLRDTTARFVRHRIDGLEKLWLTQKQSGKVRHRIDGLEICHI
ncbi:hypothetical protein ENHYD8BJ_140115 [Enhydrobacter sp. 8BJ]|nr:hypothetical protein ENHYD8BJ_140115 [Enhydrobacter sp. 8BJ]